jgi:hypothetical protein
MQAAAMMTGMGGEVADNLESVGAAGKEMCSRRVPCCRGCCLGVCAGVRGCVGTNTRRRHHGCKGSSARCTRAHRRGNRYQLTPNPVGC